VPFEPPTHPNVVVAAPTKRANVQVHLLTDRRIACSSARTLKASLLPTLFARFAFPLALRLLGILLGLRKGPHLGHAFARLAAGKAGHPHAWHAHARHHTHARHTHAHARH